MTHSREASLLMSSWSAINRKNSRCSDSGVGEAGGHRHQHTLGLLRPLLLATGWRQALAPHLQNRGAKDAGPELCRGVS